MCEWLLKFIPGQPEAMTTRIANSIRHAFVARERRDEILRFSWGVCPDNRDEVEACDCALMNDLAELNDLLCALKPKPLKPPKPTWTYNDLFARKSEWP